MVLPKRFHDEEFFCSRESVLMTINLSATAKDIEDKREQLEYKLQTLLPKGCSRTNTPYLFVLQPPKRTGLLP
jgi:hypothetical protein